MDVEVVVWVAAGTAGAIVSVEPGERSAPYRLLCIRERGNNMREKPEKLTWIVESHLLADRCGVGARALISRL